MMKRFIVYVIIDIIILAELIYIGYNSFTSLLHNNPSICHLDLYYVIAAISLTSFLFGATIMLIINYKKTTQLKEYQRELEKRGIDRDSSSSRVKVLESKIEVLEKALQDSLNNK